MSWRSLKTQLVKMPVQGKCLKLSQRSLMNMRCSRKVMLLVLSMTTSWLQMLGMRCPVTLACSKAMRRMICREDGARGVCLVSNETRRLVRPYLVLIQVQGRMRIRGRTDLFSMLQKRLRRNPCVGLLAWRKKEMSALLGVRRRNCLLRLRSVAVRA